MSITERSLLPGNSLETDFERFNPEFKPTNITWENRDFRFGYPRETLRQRRRISHENPVRPAHNDIAECCVESQRCGHVCVVEGCGGSGVECDLQRRAKVLRGKWKQPRCRFHNNSNNNNNNSDESDNCYQRQPPGIKYTLTRIYTRTVLSAYNAHARGNIFG